MPSDGEAEVANATGNRLYREGNVEAAAEAYTSAIQLSSLLATAKGGGGGGGGGGVGAADDYGDVDGGGLKARSKYYANRAQARMQAKDFEEAAQDCQSSVGEDPRNAKALVRWGLCEEALGRWQGALHHFQRACALLQQGTALHKTALDGKRRAEVNAAADRKVAHEEAMPQELVHRGQMLRLSFRDLLPTECCPGEWFPLSVGLSNEFGLWRRSDFARPDSETEMVQATKPLPASSSSCSSGSSSSGASPPCSCPSRAPVSSCLEEELELEEALKASLGAGTTTAGRLTLVVETRHLEGFGGRSEAGCGPARDSAGKTACSCGGPQTTPTPPITSVRSTDRKGGGEPAQTFAKQHGDPSAVAAAGRQGSSRWVVETDGDSAIGPEGKVTLRARFVAAPCSGRGGGGGGTSACGVCGVSEEWSSEKSGGSGSIGQVVPRPDVGDGVARGRPLLMLLRVSVVEDEAMALLGRRVVPVLSLPIAVAEADPGTNHAHGSQVGQGVEARSTEQTEQGALATNAFGAGAISCREVVLKAVPATPAATAAAAIAAGGVSSQPRRLGGGVRNHCSANGHHPDEAALCDQISNEQRQGSPERPDGVGGCGGGDRGCRGGGGGGSGEGSVNASMAAASLEERTVLVAESPGQLGIGGKVWDSAFVLCDYLAKAPASITLSAAATAAAIDAAPARPTPSSPTASARTAADTDEKVRCIASVGGGSGLRVAAGSSVDDDQAEQKESLRQKETGGRLGASISGRLSVSACSSAGGSGPRGDGAEEGGDGGGRKGAPTPAKGQLQGACAASARGIVEGRRVLELGAGTGLVSVCCALLGASAVVATDFDDVTKLIRLNVSLNFSNTSSSSSCPSAVDPPLPLPPLPPPLHLPANSPPPPLLEKDSEAPATQTKAEAGAPSTMARPATAADTDTATATASSPTSAASSPDRALDTSTSATANGGPDLKLPVPPPRRRRQQPPRVSGSRPTASVKAVPLVWGEKSPEVTGFAAEVVVMSDVVYDPAGYEPLLETLLEVLRPGMIAIMAHRHRHPEDQKFFRRLEQLFHVLEDDEAQPSRAGNPLPPTPMPTTGTTEQAHGGRKTPSGVPRGGREAQPTARVGNPRSPTPVAGTARAHGDPLGACPAGVLHGGRGALRENIEENENGTAGKGDAVRGKMTVVPRSHGAVDVPTRAAGPSSCDNTAYFGVRGRGAAAAGAGAGACADDAARVGGKTIAADPERERDASNGRGGKCDGADVRIFCIWSRQGKVQTSSR